MPSHKPAVRFIFLTLLLDVLGFGLIIPVAPRLVEQLGGGTEADAARYVGLLAATYSAMQFLFAPVLGVLSDRFGRRPVILIALLGSGLDFLAMGFAQSLPVLFITRAINGLSGASFTVGSAYIADVTPPEKRAGAFGMIGAAFGLGFVLGPLLGGFLGDEKLVLPLLGHGNIRYPFYAAGLLTLINWCYGMFVLPESLPRERRGHFTLARANPIGALFGLVRYPLVAGLAGSLFLVNLAQFALHATWVLYTKHRFEWTPRDVGLSLFAVGIGAALVQGGLARKVIPALGEKRSLLISLALAVLVYAAYGAATHGWMMYVAIAVGALCGIGQPAAQAMITRTVRPYEQGSIQGALASGQNIANIVGPLIGATVFAYSISPGAGPFKVPGMVFFVGAGLTALGWVAAAWAVSRHGRHWDRHEHGQPQVAPAPEGAAAAAN